jgi:hypothetical protein
MHGNFPVDLPGYGLIINLERNPSSATVKYGKIGPFGSTFELVGMFISLLINFLPIADFLNIVLSLYLPGAPISTAVILYRASHIAIKLIEKLFL